MSVSLVPHLFLESAEPRRPGRKLPGARAVGNPGSCGRFYSQSSAARSLVRREAQVFSRAPPHVPYSPSLSSPPLRPYAPPPPLTPRPCAPPSRFPAALGPRPARLQPAACSLGVRIRASVAPRAGLGTRPLEAA